MVINTNIAAQNAAANLETSSTQLAKSLSRLSSGSKITAASDDAAGLAVSTNMNAIVNRLNAAKGNVASAVSFAQTQDGLLAKVGSALDRMSELSILSQDATKTNQDRGFYDKEFQTLAAYVSNTATKDFNGVSLFTATAMAVTIDSEGSTFNMGAANMGASAYTSATASNVATTTGAVAALTAIKAAISQLTADRATVGANESRLNYTSAQLMVNAQNLTAASSQIQDVDVAQESTQYARENILVQSGTAMLAQANQLPNSVLKLLQ